MADKTKRRPGESLVAYAARVGASSSKTSDVYKTKPKPKPKPGSVEHLAAAAKNGKPSKVFEQKPKPKPKAGSVEHLASVPNNKPSKIFNQPAVGSIEWMAGFGRPLPPSVGTPTPRPKSPAVGAPIHASPQNFGSVSKIQDGVMSGAGTSPYAPQAGAAPKPNTPQPSSYGADGKSLYNAGKGDNPLMQRTFGYQTGQHPGAQQPQPAAPAQPQQPMSPQYNGNDEPGALGQAENPMKLLSDLLNRKKLSISVSN